MGILKLKFWKKYNPKTDSVLKTSSKQRGCHAQGWDVNEDKSMEYVGPVSELTRNPFRVHVRQEP